MLKKKSKGAPPANLNSFEVAGTEQKRWYLPENGGYQMNRAEQQQVYAGLKDRRRDVGNEIAGIEVLLETEATELAALSELLRTHRVEGIDWGGYQKRIAELPLKAARYQERKIELTNVQAQLDKFIGFD